MKGRAGSSCSLHGTTASPVPMGDLPEATVQTLTPLRDPFLTGSPPVAVRFQKAVMEVLISSEEQRSDGIRWLDQVLRPQDPEPEAAPLPSRAFGRRLALEALLDGRDRAKEVLERLTGWTRVGQVTRVAPIRVLPELLSPMSRGGILTVKLSSIRDDGPAEVTDLIFVGWR